MYWGVGVAREKLMGEKGDICDTLNNKEIIKKKLPVNDYLIVVFPGTGMISNTYLFLHNLCFL